MGHPYTNTPLNQIQTGLTYKGAKNIMEKVPSSVKNYLSKPSSLKVASNIANNIGKEVLSGGLYGRAKNLIGASKAINEGVKKVVNWDKWQNLTVERCNKKDHSSCDLPPAKEHRLLIGGRKKKRSIDNHVVDMKDWN